MARQSLWMLFATFCFSVMFLLSKLCTAETGPFEIMFYRAGVGLAAITGLMLRKGISFRTRYPLAHLRRCACGITAFGSELLALSLIALAIEQTITYTAPLFLCLFLSIEALLAGRRLDRVLLAAVAIGFAGVLLIVRPDVSGLNALGAMFAFSGAFFAAAVGMCLRNLARYGEPTEGRDHGDGAAHRGGPVGSHCPGRGHRRLDLRACAFERHVPVLGHSLCRFVRLDFLLGAPRCAHLARHQHHLPGGNRRRRAPKTPENEMNRRAAE